MILKEIVDLMEIACKEMGTDYRGMRICELGDQIVKWSEHWSGKKYLLAAGAIEHVSIDLNGRSGALKKDLSKPIEDWKNYFDMVTNYGTAEHVKNGIYQCFKNIHNWVKVNGAMVHAGPPAKGCPWHSPYHYESWFFEKLAEKNNYKHIMSEVRLTQGRRGVTNPLDRSLVCSVLIKKEDKEFITLDEFKNIGGIEGLL